MRAVRTDQGLKFSDVANGWLRKEQIEVTLSRMANTTEGNAVFL